MARSPKFREYHKSGNLGFILEPSGENIQSINIITSDVVDENKQVVSKAKEVKI